jgi:hypothetical protein
MGWGDIFKIWSSQPSETILDKKTDIDYENVVDTDVVFVRKYRWTLESNDGLEAHWIKNVNFNWMNNSMSVEMLEAYCKETKEIPTLEWAESHLEDEEKVFEIKFTTYDGCGNELYVKTFSNCYVISLCPSNFNYDCSDPSTIVAGIKFGTWETEIK